MFTKIHSQMFDDEKLSTMKDLDKISFFYLLGNRYRNMSGFYIVNYCHMCRFIGVKENELIQSLINLSNAKMIFFEPSSRIVFIKNFLKYNKVLSPTQRKGLVVGLDNVCVSSKFFPLFLEQLANDEDCYGILYDICMKFDVIDCVTDNVISSVRSFAFKDGLESPFSDVMASAITDHQPTSQLTPLTVSKTTGARFKDPLLTFSPGEPSDFSSPKSGGIVTERFGVAQAPIQYQGNISLRREEEERPESPDKQGEETGEKKEEGSSSASLTPGSPSPRHLEKEKSPKKWERSGTTGAPNSSVQDSDMGSKQGLVKTGNKANGICSAENFGAEDVVETPDDVCFSFLRKLPKIGNDRTFWLVFKSMKDGYYAPSDFSDVTKNLNIFYPRIAEEVCSLYPKKVLFDEKVKEEMGVIIFGAIKRGVPPILIIINTKAYLKENGSNPMGPVKFLSSCKTFLEFVSGKESSELNELGSVLRIHYGNWLSGQETLDRGRETFNHDSITCDNGKEGYGGSLARLIVGNHPVMDIGIDSVDYHYGRNKYHNADISMKLFSLSVRYLELKGFVPGSILEAASRWITQGNPRLSVFQFVCEGLFLEFCDGGSPDFIAFNPFTGDNFERGVFDGDEFGSLLLKKFDSFVRREKIEFKSPVLNARLCWS